MNPTTRVRQLLDEHDFSLVRHRKHNIYRSPSGLTFVCPHTGSDSRRGDWNSLRDLKRVLRQNGLPIEFPEREESAASEQPNTGTVQLTQVPTLEVVEPTPAPVATKPDPLPLTKAEQKKLARWEKNYAEKEAKRAAFMSRLSYFAGLCSDLFDMGAEDSVVASAAAHVARKEGFQSRLLLVTAQARNKYGATQKAIIYLVGVNGYHLDPRTSAIWEPGKAFPGPHTFSDCTVEFCSGRKSSPRRKKWNTAPKNSENGNN